MKVVPPRGRIVGCGLDQCESLTLGNNQLSHEPGNISNATLISRSPSVLTAEVDGEIVMMSIERGRYFGLDAIGSEIWKRIEPPCSFAALVDWLTSEYDADRTVIARDVRRLLERMAAQDAVRLG